MAKPEISDRVRERITGFTGIVTGKVEYITGCKQCLVVPPAKPDGSLVDASWFDEDRLEVLATKQITIPIANDGFCEAAPVK